MKSIDRYKNKVYHALAGFQLIEQVIKDYLDAYYKLVRLSLPKGITFNFTREQINGAPLSKLLSHFSKASSNTVLIARIRGLNNKRDHLAHNALVEIYKKVMTEDEYETAITDYTLVTDEINQIVKELIDDTNNLADIFSKKFNI